MDKLHFDRTDYSVVVKNRAPPPSSWKWEIYRAGRSSPIKQSSVYFHTMVTANRAGKEALKQLLDKLPVIPTLTNTDSPCPASCRHPRLKMRVKSGLSCSQAMAPIILGRGGRYLDPFGAARGSREATHGRGPGTRYAINFALRAASSACSHAAGSVSATPRATTSWPLLMTSQYQCTFVITGHNAEFNAISHVALG